METDILLRLVAATAIGMTIGISHDLRGKPTGMRTLGLVALGAALVTLGTTRMPLIAASPDALSRVVQGVIQGVMAGIGFLGAGTILRGSKEVHGLTTAAGVWATAALGIVCALSPWWLIGVGAALAFGLVAVAHPLERKIERWRERRASDNDAPGQP
jgi:putative Mg2+ transporter-C (MgtC) family protein